MAITTSIVQFSGFNLAIVCDDNSLFSAHYVPASLLATPVRGYAHKVVTQLQEYTAGSRTLFDLDISFSRVSDFARSVYACLQEVTYGETMSYSELARSMGRPTATRAVASAVANNPVMIIVPCHRIIRADGSYGDYAGGQHLKRMLLDSERSNKK